MLFAYNNIFHFILINCENILVQIIFILAGITAIWWTKTALLTHPVFCIFTPFTHTGKYKIISWNQLSCPFSLTQNSCSTRSPRQQQLHITATTAELLQSWNMLSPPSRLNRAWPWCNNYNPSTAPVYKTLPCITLYTMLKSHTSSSNQKSVKTMSTSYINNLVLHKSCSTVVLTS